MKRFFEILNHIVFIAELLVVIFGGIALLLLAVTR